ncbi:ABC transporter permease [Candidatus Bipolaricaulota bacterium]|nr:ABC transporter permease [Candidatus Bipolaricaulota bacterium]
MTDYIARRLLVAVFTLFVITFIVFLFIRLTPGDPIQTMLSSGKISPDLADDMRAYYKLDKPIYVQYGNYLWKLAHGDLGFSFTTRRPVVDSIAQVFPNTLQLTVAAVLVAFSIAIPLGILSSVHRNTPIDHLCRIVSMIGISMPNFWLGLLLLMWFGLRLNLLPMWGMGSLSDGLWDYVSHLILPAVTLGTALAGLLTRLTRSSFLDKISQDYVKTARAKGLKERVVLYKHVLRNAIIPVVSMGGLQFGALLGGSMIVETIFAWPGMGRLAINAIQKRDFPVLQGTTLVFAASLMVTLLLVDIINSFIDPAIRYD